MKPSTHKESGIKINRKFKIDYPEGKRLKKIIDEKDVSAPRKVSVILKQIPIEKMRFQVLKYEKYLKSKNDLKRPLGPFIKDYEQFKFFRNSVKF